MCDVIPTPTLNNPHIIDSFGSFSVSGSNVFFTLMPNLRLFFVWT